MNEGGSICLPVRVTCREARSAGMGETERVASNWPTLGPLLLFGSPVLAVGFGWGLFFAFDFPELAALVGWVFFVFPAALGSSAGAAMWAGDPEKELSAAGFGAFAGAIGYGVLSMVTFLMYGMYIMTFRFI